MRPNKEWTLQTAIDQLERCNFQCEAGPLALNEAFIWLKQLASKTDGPLTAQVRKILGAGVLMLVLLVAIARAGQSETIDFRVEVNDREQVTIWLINRQFTDEHYLGSIARKLKTVSVSLKTGSVGAIVLNAPRETNPALASPGDDERSKFWAPKIALVMGKLRAKIAPTATLTQHMDEGHK